MSLYVSNRAEICFGKLFFRRSSFRGNSFRGAKKSIFVDVEAQKWGKKEKKNFKI